MKKKLIISLLAITTILIGSSMALNKKDNPISKYVVAEANSNNDNEKETNSKDMFDSYFNKNTNSNTDKDPAENDNVFSNAKKELDSKSTSISIPVKDSVLKKIEGKSSNIASDTSQKHIKGNQSTVSVAKNSQSDYTPKQEPTPTPKQEPTPTPKQEPTPTPKQEPTPTPKQEPTKKPYTGDRPITNRRIDTEYPAGLFSESDINNAINNNTAFIATDTNGNNRVNIPIRIEKNSDGSVTVYVNENMELLFDRSKDYYFFISPSRNWCDSLHIG